MNLRDIQKSWNALGQKDPLWAILTDSQKKGNKWRIDDFFETGAIDVREIMQYIDHLEVNLSRQRVLDFGCGIGRLTQALGDYFDEVYGIDIAPSMIELAKQYNRHGERCKYLLNDTDDLRIFPDNTFDFVYSKLVLQHNPPQYSKNYIKEFVRIVRSGGLIIFQLPGERRVTLRSRFIERLIPRLWERYSDARLEGIRMYPVKKEDIVRLLEESGAILLDIERRTDGDWISLQYAVTKATV
jgi:SAM-dependent methyltransferase